MNKIVIAIDSFKGCLTSAEANQAAAEGFLTRPVVNENPTEAPELIQIPVSDGGEGWLEAFRSAMGGELIEVNVYDPLMRPITAQYLIKGDTAVIEMAKASGLTLLSPEERHPMRATSYGTGQLIADAVRRGCRHIIAGLGGSATSDCGIGMLRAIIDAFAKHGTWDELRIPTPDNLPDHRLDNIRFTIATDVTNPLCGDKGAAHVFAPQKGATPEMVLALDERARRFAEVSARHFGYDRQNVPGAGAAGGLGYAFLQYMNAECRSGIDLLLDTIGFDEQIKDAKLIITGEGSADQQTLMGKLPYGILQRAKGCHVPVVLIAGRIADRQTLLNAGFTLAESINPPHLPLTEAMKPETAKKNIRQLIQTLSLTNKI